MKLAGFIQVNLISRITWNFWLTFKLNFAHFQSVSHSSINQKSNWTTMQKALSVLQSYLWWIM